MKSNTRNKIIALVAAGVIAFSGAAWANILNDSLNGTTKTADTVLDKVQPAGTGPSVANTFNQIIGGGTVTGSIRANNATGDGAAAGGVTPLVLRLKVAAGGTLTIAPALDAVTPRLITQSATGNANSAALAGGVNANFLQISVNQGGTDNGKVVIQASNGNNPTAATNTMYYGGTFVYGGTLAISHNNSLGQGWVGIVGRPATATRKGATLSIESAQNVLLGQPDVASRVTGQPVYLVNDNTATLGGGIYKAYINVDMVNDNPQRLELRNGLGEVIAYTTETNNAGIAVGNAWVDFPLTLDTQTPATRARFAAGLRYAELVKTGKGVLFIDPNGVGFGGPLAANWQNWAIDGARHEGGTRIEGGTLIIEGGNATVWQDRYEGYLGSVWNKGALVQTNGYVANSATGDTGIHNPLYMTNDSKLIVDRSQLFSFFRSTKDNEFTAKQFNLAGVNERPFIIVGLNREHSDFDGRMNGSFDLLLDSRQATVGQTAGTALANDGQPQLKLGYASNDIVGETYVHNGVLAVAGAKSIAYKGTGSLNVGRNDDTAALFGARNKAVFLGLANAKFENPTFVTGFRTWKYNSGLAGGDNVTSDGALAAVSGVKTSYKNVTIKRAMEINPQAVTENVAIAAGRNEAVIWTNTNSYPTWDGTVAFGVDSGDVYRIGGNTTQPTQIAVSRGTWHLGNMPADMAAGAFANVMLRETATLSLGKDVNDFSKTFDLQVDDDARVRVVLRESDLATSRAAALAKPAVFAVRTLDTTWLGSGEVNRDRRLAIQVDVSGLPTKSLKKGQWIRVIGAQDAIRWNNLHFLRENSTTNYEDYAKVRPGFVGNVDLTNKVVAHMDENGYSILLEVTEDVSSSGEVVAPVTSPDTKPVTSPDVEPVVTGGGSSGGCDAGFGVLALAAAAAIVLRKKD